MDELNSYSDFIEKLQQATTVDEVKRLKKVYDDTVGKAFSEYYEVCEKIEKLEQQKKNIKNNATFSGFYNNDLSYDFARRIGQIILAEPN